ncbi:hypothetical protein SAMN05660485_00031 [Blastococcus fimeti]|nr:hypothetical protein SAMN05660485_00031 [Blastococcus fimeti]
MSQFSPRRAVTAAGLALGTAALGVALAPAAMAAPAVTVSQSTVAPGATYTVSGTECVSQDADYDAMGVVFLAVGAQSADAEEAAANGTWTMTQTAPTEAGTYTFAAVCDWYTDGFDYDDFTITVAAPSTPSKPSAAPAPAPAAAPVAAGTPRGAAAITAGVASPDTGAATGDRAPLGEKVVKVLTGFKPFEVVTVTLNSTPTRVGSFTADASGTVRIEFTVPAGTPVGDHTLVYEGDKGTYFQESFAVAAATTGSARLASTGASVALPLSLGLGALAAGGGLVFAARRRSAGAVQA